MQCGGGDVFLMEPKDRACGLNGVLRKAADGECRDGKELQEMGELQGSILTQLHFQKLQEVVIGNI